MHCLVEDFYSTVKENEEGQNRIIEYEVVVKAEGRVETVRPAEVLVDAYSPTVNLEAFKSKIRFKKTLDSLRDEIAVKEELGLPANFPQIMEICDVKAAPVLTDFGVYEDRAVVEGVLSIQALYLTTDSEEQCTCTRMKYPSGTVSSFPTAGSRWTWTWTFTWKTCSTACWTPTCSRQGQR